MLGFVLGCLGWCCGWLWMEWLDGLAVGMGWILDALSGRYNGYNQQSNKYLISVGAYSLLVVLVRAGYDY